MDNINKVVNRYLYTAFTIMLVFTCCCAVYMANQGPFLGSSALLTFSVSLVFIAAVFDILIRRVKIKHEIQIGKEAERSCINEEQYE